MTLGRPVPRYLGVIVLLAMAGFASVGFFAIRRDVENLRVISQDNTQWSASQMEIELLRFRLSLAALLADPSPEALDAMHERFDILWSRVFMMGHGRLGESLERYDGEHGSVASIADYLKEIDPLLAGIDPTRPGIAARFAEIEARLDTFQQDLRQYTLRVMRADGAAASRVRERIQVSARITAVISVAAVLLSVLALFLILHENRRQRQIAEMSRRSAEQAELASRAKSRFLVHDEPRAAGTRSTASSGRWRCSGRATSPGASTGWSRRRSSRASRCCRCCRACSTTARCRTAASG